MNWTQNHRFVRNRPWSSFLTLWENKNWAVVLEKVRRTWTDGDDFKTNTSKRVLVLDRKKDRVWGHVYMYKDDRVPIKVKEKMSYYEKIKRLL